ncbi:NADH:flavin oxidoreductase [Algiphilus sp.]|uniref:NADH:flavin oxidoreductase n=1 Tax=Algiphilus sp. TaxID=1872431 RepID=UPI0025C10315|nr:NADH:flavin oxidoreductase [Algiphilus sp.]MCK5769665.1 NADH:flavin oxidoreductase [Algiphilus sp.]
MTAVEQPDEARAFTPVTVGPLTLRNRFIKSATNEGMARGGVPSRALVEHHRRIAAGGAAMTTVAYCAVTADGRTFEDQVTLDDATLPHLRALTDAVRAEGAAACAQITHGGCFTFLPELSTRYPLSASGGFNPPGAISGRFFKTAMTEADMDTVAEAFAAGARRAREAGFDAVEIHMGHGYLLSQFLSPAYNRRRDAWGGNAERRARFPVAVLRRVLDAVGDTMAVTCKLSVVEGHRRGAPLEDVITTARALEAAGAHMLVLSGGMNVEAPWQIFGSNMPAAAVTSIQNPVVRVATRLMRLWEPRVAFEELYLRPYSQQVRGAVTMPLAYLGGAKSMDGVGSVMADGFDCVVMGRALIHDAQLVRRFERGETRVSGCTACNECVVTMYGPGGTHCVLTGSGDPDANSRPAAG